jgi:hypothetical protein
VPFDRRSAQAERNGLISRALELRPKPPSRPVDDSAVACAISLAPRSRFVTARVAPRLRSMAKMLNPPTDDPLSESGNRLIGACIRAHYVLAGTIAQGAFRWSIFRPATAGPS